MYNIDIKYFGGVKTFLAKRNGRRFIFNDNIGCGASSICIGNKMLLNFEKI